MKTMHNFHQVWRQFGFLPEYYNIPKSEAHTGREGYPLRPGSHRFYTLKCENEFLILNLLFCIFQTE
jgi:hypothetical protein